MQLLPIPRWLQYDPDKPVEFNLLLNIVFAFASTMIVCNLYYCQQLLIQLAASFGVDNTRVADIPTLTQAGYAAGLLLLSPLGDLVPRRTLILVLLICSTCFALGLALAPNLEIFSVVTFLVGVANVTTQVLLPLTADLAPPERHAQAMSIALSAVLLGLTAARVLAGIIAQYTGPGQDGWRNVYWMAFCAQIVTFAMLYLTLPDLPTKNKGTGLTYWGTIKTMARLAVTEPLLTQCSLLGFFTFAIFGSFWVTLTFLLGGAPYHYSTLQIGLFGLIGALGVLSAPLIGRGVDRLHSPWLATLIAVGLLFVSGAVIVGEGGFSVGAIVVAAFGLDLGFQLQQIRNATWIYSIDAHARARRNAVFVISCYVGQVMGTQSGTRVFARAGWRAASALNLAWAGGILLVLLLRGPRCPTGVWYGGWRRTAVAQNGENADTETQDKTAAGSNGSRENRPLCRDQAC